MEHSLDLAGLGQLDDAQRVARVRDWLDELGFRWLEVMRVGPGRTREPLAPWRALAPCGRDDNCGASPCGHDDPREALALASPVPFLWDVSTLARSAPCVAQLQEHGIASGVSCAVRRGDGAGARVVVATFMSTLAGREWMCDAIVARALLIACRVTAIARPHDDDRCIRFAASLTATQRDILDCLCQGLGDKVIADRLGMSTHNVDYHLRRLRQRFGARNRVQLSQLASVRH